MGEEIKENWENIDEVAIIHFLDDIGQPYSCSQWGEAGASGSPSIIDDGLGKTVNKWFSDSSNGTYPLTIFIDHTMKITNIMEASPSATIANLYIQNMLNEMPVLSNNNLKGTISNFNLTNLYPNPFNPVLNIDYELNQSGMVEIIVMDISGMVVGKVYEGFKNFGVNKLNWDSKGLPSGTYFVSLNFENSILTKKVVLLK